MSFGKYPDATLALARERHDTARKVLKYPAVRASQGAISLRDQLSTGRADRGSRALKEKPSANLNDALESYASGDLSVGAAGH